MSDRKIVGSVRVQELMAEGYSLGLTSGLNAYAWLQKGGLGRGVSTKLGRDVIGSGVRTSIDIGRWRCGSI